MSYDKTNDFKSIQADVLTIDTTDNENISNLKQLKTDNKSVTKAINALNEQLGNAQVSAADAVQRVVVLEQTQAEVVTLLQQRNSELEQSNTTLQARVNELEAQLGGGSSAGQNDPEHGEVVLPGRAEHIMGMVLVEEGNQTGTWARVDQEYNTVEFNPEHGTWAGIKTITDDVYGEFVEIPVTYVKTETLTDGIYAGKNCWWIADGPADGFHVHPAFVGADGQPHNLQISAYFASNNGENLPISVDLAQSSDDYWKIISYNELHAMSLSDGYRPYSIYDHHFLARMMLIEFGSTNTRSQIGGGDSWTSPNEPRTIYHGMYDLFGVEYDIKTSRGVGYCFLDGLTVINGTYQLLAGDGSRQMIETGIQNSNKNIYFPNCHMEKVNNIDFGDVFVGISHYKASGYGYGDCSFTDYQNHTTYTSDAVTAFTTSFGNGMFHINSTSANSQGSRWGFRLSRCV